MFLIFFLYYLQNIFYITCFGTKYIDDINDRFFRYVYIYRALKNSRSLQTEITVLYPYRLAIFIHFCRILNFVFDESILGYLWEYATIALIINRNFEKSWLYNYFIIYFNIMMTIYTITLKRIRIWINWVKFAVIE